MEMTDGGADYCFECVGKASLMEDAYASSRRVSLLFYLSISQSCIALWLICRQKYAIKTVTAL